MIATDDKGFRLLRDELFGPIVTTYVYDEKRWDDTLELVDETAPYALTGAVFATERAAIEEAHDALRYSAGNFYVNDKPTGRGRRPAAVRRLACERDERQGRLDVEPHPLGVAAHGQGDLRPADRLPLPVPRAGFRRQAAQGISRRLMAVRILDGVDAFLDQLGSVDFRPARARDRLPSR